MNRSACSRWSDLGVHDRPKPASKTPSERLRSPHPLIAEALHHFDRRNVSPEGILYGHSKDRHLYLSVSPALFPRATRFVDALLKLLEKSAQLVALPADGKGGFVATVNDQSLRIHVREQLQQVRVQEEYGERTRLTPAGRLEVLIDEYLDGTRKRWADGKKRGAVEDQVETIYEGLRTAAEAKRRREEEWAEQRRKSEAEAQRQQAEAERQREEERRADDLEHQADRWARSKRIRTYLAAVEEWGRRPDRPPDPSGELQRWLTWARDYAERLDPLGQRPTPTRSG